MNDESNEDVAKKPIIPIILSNIRAELSKNRLFLLEMKVNPDEVDPATLDVNQTEVNQVYHNFDKLAFNFAFSLFEYKDNAELVCTKFDE